MSESLSRHKKTQYPRKKGNRNLSKPKEKITDTMSPFNENLNKELLFNVKTSRKLNAEAEQYLLSIFNKGVEKRDTLNSECRKDLTIFKSSITKTKMVNFVTDNVMKNNKSKLQRLPIQKQPVIFFVVFFYLLLPHNISIGKILEYPIFPEPPCFCCPDCPMQKKW